MPYQINSKYCSCCHFCKTECPVNAIRFKGTKYWIDPEKCIECGRCAEVCNSSLITKIGEKEQITPHETVQLSCDILVAGAGAAGLIAAAKAASEGRKVILLEKEKKAGGSCWYAGGYRTWYSKVHKANGIEEDPRPAMLQDFIAHVGHGTVDEELLARIFEANGEMVDWIYERGDMKDCFIVGKNPWGQMAVHMMMPYNVERPVRIDPTIGPGSMGSSWVLTMLKLCEKFGVKVMTGVGAKKILLDDSGKVSRVIASDAGGKYEITCDAFVVATGAMTHNDEIIKRFKPEFIDTEGFEPVHKFTPPGCTGDGIVMCEELGADMDFVNTRVAMFGPAHHPFPYPGLAITRSPYGLTVNCEGKTFMGENGMVGAAAALLKQPKHICYMIFDQNMVEKAVEANMQGRGDGNGRGMFGNWRAELEEEIALGTPVKRADTLEELAVMIGAAPETFVKTIEEYNESVNNPAPSQEGPAPEGFMGIKLEKLPIKEGPYYAFFQKFFHENAVGGMTIDKQCHVMKQGIPIPGLFAAGDTCRGIMCAGEVGVDYIESVITALTSAVTLGYMAGDEAVKYTAV